MVAFCPVVVLAGGGGEVVFVGPSRKDGPSLSVAHADGGGGGGIQR